MEERIKAVMAAAIGIAPETITDETSPATEEAWDSLRHMHLVLALEEEFGVEFSDQQLADLSSFVGIRTALAQLVS